MINLAYARNSLSGICFFFTEKIDMKRFSSLQFIILSLLGLIALNTSCKKETVVEGELKLLAYNVAGLPEGLSSSNPELYTSRISPLLNNYNIVHVQEDFCYHDSLILYVEHEYMTDPMPCVPDGDGLNTFSDYPILDFERQAWTECSSFDCLTPKGFSYSKIEVAADVHIDFYNIHCNSGSTDEAFEARRGNMFQLMDYIDTHSEGEAIIIMGDFNNRYTRPEDTIRIMQNNGFVDLWVELIRDGDIPDFGQSLKDCDETGTNPNCEGVDKFFYRNSDAIQFTALSFQYGDDPRFLYNGIDTLPLSDHKPLIANVRYRKE